MGTPVHPLFPGQHDADSVQSPGELGDQPVGTAPAILGVFLARLAFAQLLAHPYSLDTSKG